VTANSAATMMKQILWPTAPPMSSGIRPRRSMKNTGNSAHVTETTEVRPATHREVYRVVPRNWINNVGLPGVSVVTATEREEIIHVVCDTVDTTELLHAHHPASEENAAQVLGWAGGENQLEVGFFGDALKLNDFPHLVKVDISGLVAADM